MRCSCRQRLETAIAFRESLGIDATAYRLVHGEADLLPSLIVDRYGDYLVVQALSQGMDRLMPAVVASLNELLQPRGILARNDPRARVLEGLEQRVDVLFGEVPEAVTVTETGIEYDVDLRRGQKTGLFLDQRENRAAAAAYARGRMLDCFSYNGGFALVMGRRCTETIAFDVSEDAVARIKQNAARNGVAVDARAGNVFDELRGLDRLGERFDTIVLDPPAFAKNKASVVNATAGYKEINLRALRLLEAGRHARHLQLLVQHQRGDLRRDRARGIGRRAGARDGRREADAGARSPGAARRARDLLPEVLHPAEAVGARQGRSVAATGQPEGKLPMTRDEDDSTQQAPTLEDRFFAVAIDLLCVLDFNGYFKRLNPAWEKALGFTIAELQSKPFIEFVHPDDRERTLRQNREVRTGGRALSFENRYLCKDGSYRWLLWNAAPDFGQQVIYSVARDVSERKLAEAERERLLQELRAALAEVKTLREILPICSYCRKIRNDQNYWDTVENYISQHTNSRFSHSVCPDCYKNELEPEIERLKP